MNSTETSTEKPNEQNENEQEEKNYDMTKIEAMLTPEQVLSDSVARKRRKFTKKRSTSLTRRDPTPVRQLDDKATTTTTSEDDDAATTTTITKPKTPERPRRKFHKRKDFSETESEPGTPSTPQSNSIQKSNSIPKQFLQENLADLAQSEVKAFFNKTKKSISAAANRGRDRFRKNTTKEQVKRSQSAPHHFTEEELIESFRKAQLLSADNEVITPQPPDRKNSESSLISLITPEPIPSKPKPFRPEVQEFVRQRKKQRGYSTKIIEILDPETSTVIGRKTLIRPTFKFRELFGVLRMFTIFEIRNSYKAYRNEMKHESNRIRVLWNRCMCELLLIMIFCGLGGIMFKFTEGSFENFYKCGVKRVKRDFIDQLWLKSHNLREEDWKSMARNKLRYFEEELHVAHEAGMTSYSGQRSWSFLNGVVYALTIITTIGYGHMYPTTTTGRALTIVYSIIGIPLFLIALTDFGKLFTRCIKFLWSFVRRLYYTGSCKTVRKTAHVQDIFKGAQMMYDIATFRRPSTIIDPENPAPTLGQTSPSINTIGADTETPTTPAISNFEIDDEFNLPISVAIFILIIYIFLGALIYCMWEHWDFFASFYFVFISMSTIGFGDYVPRHPICMIVSIVYLVFGLALMSMCINVVQVKLSDTFKHASAKIGATIGLQVVDEDGSITTVPPDNVEMVGVHDVAVAVNQTPNDVDVKDKEV